MVMTYFINYGLVSGGKCHKIESRTSGVTSQAKCIPRNTSQTPVNGRHMIKINQF